MFFKLIKVLALHPLKNELFLIIQQSRSFILTRLIIRNIDNPKQILVDLQIVKIQVIYSYSILYFIVCTIPNYKLFAFQTDINQLNF
jgi:hypothetical protein